MSVRSLIPNQRQRVRVAGKERKKLETLFNINHTYKKFLLSFMLLDSYSTSVGLIYNISSFLSTCIFHRHIYNNSFDVVVV